jgi:hypothetical protein
MIARKASKQFKIVYRYPIGKLVGFLDSLIRLKPRSFATDAQTALSALQPPLRVMGGEHVPRDGGCLVVCNHYYRPGFRAWWIALAVSAATAQNRHAATRDEIYWVMTSAWRFERSEWKRFWLTPLSRLVFKRIAQIYGFVLMPPMPPSLDEVEDRANAVRRILQLARYLAKEGGILGLAPEGRDVPERLGDTPPGAGRFISLLVQAGLTVLPAGITEKDGCLQVRFGQVFTPNIPANRAVRDVSVANEVMQAIAKLV